MASRAILALNAPSNLLRDLVIYMLHRLRQSRTLHTLTSGPISGVHFSLSSVHPLICSARIGDARGDLANDCAPAATTFLALSNRRLLLRANGLW
jgi:hypothetical protein